MAKSTSQSPFSNWLNNKSNNTPELASIDADQDDDESESFSLLGQVQSIQDSFTSQLQELSGSLPDAGPLSAGFRKRIKYSIYLLFGAAIFAALAIVIGIPTIVLRPSKFVICITLSTILAASSVIVMQKPSVFFGNLLKGGPVKAAPMIVLILTSLLTIYLTIFVHKYLVVIAAAGIQVLAVMWGTKRTLFACENLVYNPGNGAETGDIRVQEDYEHHHIADLPSKSITVFICVVSTRDDKNLPYTILTPRAALFCRKLIRIQEAAIL
eukprot:gene338-605_t